MKCDLLVQGFLKDEPSIWKSELNRVLEKYKFKMTENVSELRIHVPHCEEIIFSMLHKQQSLEFIYYGNDNQHLTGVFEIFWELEPYFDNFYLEDSLGIWKKIVLSQRKNIFPKICDHVADSVKRWDKELKSDDNELIGITKMKGQTIDFLNNIILINALSFKSEIFSDAVLKNVEIYFKDVDDYLFKEPLNTEVISSKFDEMVFEKESKCLLNNMQKEKFRSNDIKSVGLFKLYNPLIGLFAFSMQSAGEIYGWIVSKELWILSEGKITMKWLDNVWYHY
jgi:hypothetical protein